MGLVAFFGARSSLMPITSNDWLSSSLDRLLARGPNLAAGVVVAGCGASFLSRHLMLRPDLPEAALAFQTGAANGVTVLGCGVSVLLGGGILLLWDRKRTIERRVRAATESFGSSTGVLEKRLAALQTVSERQSRELEAMAGLMENSQGFISMKDANGSYLAVNRRFAKLHQKEPAEMVGLTDFDLVHPAEAAKSRSSDLRVISSGLPYEMEDSVTLADEGRTLLVHKFPLRGPEGAVVGVCAIAQDITDRKRAATELRESRRQLESLLGQLPGMAFRWLGDRSLKPVYVSRGALALTGYTAREFVERRVELLQLVEEPERERLRSAVMEAVAHRRSFELEFRLKDREGAIRWVMLRGQGCHDEEGRALYIEGLAIDATAKKLAEDDKAAVERELQEAQRLESIGVLAGGIAHDFNNLLTSVLGNTGLLRLDLPEDSAMQRHLGNIEEASKRAAELCRQMLAYAGKGRFVVSEVDLREVVESTAALLRSSINKKTNLSLAIDPALPRVRADETQLRQVVMNLVINASEALDGKPGDVRVSVRARKGEPSLFQDAVLAPENLAADFLELEVSDTGCGMSKETMARIFDPFFTTKFTGRGLGLSATMGILRSHSGGLRLRSETGRGTSFFVYLPACYSAAMVEEAPAAGALPELPPGSFALVVDDEEGVRDTTADLLAKCGLRVEAAPDGVAAVEMFRRSPSRYDVVLLDLTMPKLSGEETAELLREIRRDVRILFISGYNRRELLDTLEGRDRVSFLQKPFALDALRKELTELLN